VKNIIVEEIFYANTTNDVKTNGVKKIDREESWRPSKAKLHPGFIIFLPLLFTTFTDVHIQHTDINLCVDIFEYIFENKIK